MTAREALKQQIDTFTDDQLQQVADFVKFLQFRTHKAIALDPAEDTPKAQVLADFRQAWQEAQTGQGIPVAQLWEQLENGLLAD
jgi:hypothetical protein